MKILLFAIAMLALPGCAQQNVKEALDNIAHDCDRHYTFSANTGGVGGIGGSVTLAGTADCKAEGKPVTPAPVPATP
jgi:outer membrane lipoprotein-sorting protein